MMVTTVMPPSGMESGQERTPWWSRHYRKVQNSVAGEGGRCSIRGVSAGGPARSRNDQWPAFAQKQLRRGEPMARVQAAWGAWRRWFALASLERGMVLWQSKMNPRSKVWQAKVPLSWKLRRWAKVRS